MRNVEGETFEDFTKGLESIIPIIKPNEHKYFSCTLQFTNPNLKPGTRVNLEARLHLGQVTNMMTSQIIQKRNYEVQLAEGYIYNEKADYLLVVNNQTKYEETVAWRQVVSKLGGKYPNEIQNTN